MRRTNTEILDIVSTMLFTILVVILSVIMPTAAYTAPVEPAIEIVDTEEFIISDQPPVPVTVLLEQIQPPVDYYDIPLSEDLQDHIFEVCEEYNVDSDLVVSMIRKESTYTADAIGDNGRSFGLMQIQPRWHSARMAELGCNDLLDPYQNVTVGVDIIAELLEKDKGTSWALMAYNGGERYANKLAKSGKISDYASLVMSWSNDISRG